VSETPAPPDPRPRWMTALALVCLVTVAFLVPRDLFSPDTRDVEVWFGFELRGTLALLTAPLLWIIFLIGAYGFWFQRRWILPTAAAYAFYVALSHLVWSEVSPKGHGWLVGLAQALVLSIPGVLLLRAFRIACVPVLLALAYRKYRAVPGYHTWSLKLGSVGRRISVPLLLLFDLAWPFRAAALFQLVCAIDELGITWLLTECRHDVPSVLHAMRIRRG